jgi:hypothetical protein
MRELNEKVRRRLLLLYCFLFFFLSWFLSHEPNLGITILSPICIYNLLKANSADQSRETPNFYRDYQEITVIWRKKPEKPAKQA